MVRMMPAYLKKAFWRREVMRMLVVVPIEPVHSGASVHFGVSAVGNVCMILRQPEFP